MMNLRANRERKPNKGGFLFWGGLALLMICSGCDRTAQFRRADLYHEIRTSLVAYAHAHDGNLPENIDQLIEYVEAEGMDLRTLNGGKNWRQLAYVTRVTRADPQQTPVVFDPPWIHKQGRGMMLPRFGTADWITTKQAKTLIEEPWHGLQTEFDVPSEFSNFKQRVHVIVPNPKRRDTHEK